MHVCTACGVILLPSTIVVTACELETIVWAVHAKTLVGVKYSFLGNEDVQRASAGSDSALRFSEGAVVAVSAYGFN